MIPSYLEGYSELYQQDPRAAALQWFRDAQYGLFIHYGLYSLEGRHEWLQLREKIRVADYAKLADRFAAENFDAEAIAQLAVDSGMRYVNITTRHHDSFCLFKSDYTDFSSVNAPCGRDLVAELADACQKHKLGLCLYYSHGRDWRHPHAPNNDQYGGSARPEYDPPEPSYAYGDEHDLNIYLQFMQDQITELLTEYGPIASIWLDGIRTPLEGDSEAFRCQELYDHIHSLQPQVLVSYKQGITGTEDYFAPEHGVPTGQTDSLLQGKIAEHTETVVEVCTTMCPGSWGYNKDKAGTHLNKGQVLEQVNAARSGGYNLLLNTGPLPDGSLDPEDTAPLLAAGKDLQS